MQDAPTTGEPARILLIEDDPHAVLMISEMLRAIWSERLVLVQALRVDGAAQELTDHGATCVLLTLELGGTRAREQIEELRTASPTAAIVVLCEHLDEELALQSLHAGAQECLVKQDLGPALLRRTIRSAIERKRSEVELAELALHDPLTGLPNRALFLDRLGVALDRARRTGSTIAVLFVDVDNFKHINDSLGHGVGDTVLAGLSRRLSGMLRPMDTIARFGGDEFTLLFEDLSSDREVVLIADRISRAATRPIPFEDGEAKVSVSVGVATVVDPSTPPETVLREADAAMYRAKELGRSRYELFDEVSRTRALERLELEAALNHAVERSELRVHYQPKVSLSGELGVVGFEALVRWEHPERGLIGPAEFLPVAEETGTMLRIGEYVLDDALRQITRWRRQQPDITVSVNLSPRQLQDAGLVSMLAEQMRAAGIEPSALCVEVSEDAVTQDSEAATATLQGLRALGVKIAIDDYGTGSASLSDLRRLPVDSLKIHESFVGDLDGADKPAPVVGAIVDLGHAFGLDVTAEGVETDLQLARLRALGCDRAQGYFLGRPLPSEDVGALLEPSNH
ncbi:MAG: EAL domain-containing protein [Actinomycetota bacterium]|nr:EAL domain-containing protein [Actinomycetota bacterium]